MKENKKVSCYAVKHKWRTFCFRSKRNISDQIITVVHREIWLHYFGVDRLITGVCLHKIMRSMRWRDWAEGD